jgi:hypothetical protein
MPRATREKPQIQTGDDGAAEIGAPTPDTIRQAVEELGINRPFYSCRVLGNRLEFSLYGGDLVYWPPKPVRKRKG